MMPTGSFKDRGMTVMVSYLKSRGVTEVLEDSSGNAGASFAAYAARAGVRPSIIPKGSALDRFQSWCIARRRRQGTASAVP